MKDLKKYFEIFKGIPLPMSINSMDKGRFVKVNNAFVENTGYSEKDVLDKTIEELDIFIDYEKFKNIINRKLADKEIKDEQLTVKCKDGSLLVGLFSMEIISYKEEELFLTIMVDITDRIKLMEVVEDKFQKLNNIIEGTKLGTWEWNLKTGDIILNEQWVNMIGYSLEELQPIGIEKLGKLIHPKDLEHLREINKRLYNGEIDYYDNELRMRHKDERWIWVRSVGKVIKKDKNGRPIKMFGTHININSSKQAIIDLEESEKRFFFALNETGAGLWDMDLINKDIFLSKKWKSILGYKENEIQNSIEGWKKLWHPDEKEKTEKIIEGYCQGKAEKLEIIHRLKHKDGSWRWILSRGGILKDTTGKPYRFIGTNIDVTKTQRQTLELERIFKINLDLLCIIDMEGRFTKINDAWQNILGYTPKELLGHRIIGFIHKDDTDRTMKILEKLKIGQTVDGFTNRYIDSEGEYHYLEWRANPFEGLVYISMRDITERIQYEKKILEISNKDSLTGAYNRRYVYDRGREIIEEYKRTGKPFSVCILDIDHFKNINDTYGHQTGDIILKEFTKVISKNLRPYDILGRYGGEEFIVILKDADVRESHLIIRRILNIIRDKVFVISGSEISFTFSAGISNSREIDKDILIVDNLIEISDRRMYKAKNSGRNQIVSKIL